MFLQTDHHSGEADRVFEVGFVLVHVGEADVEGAVEHHLGQRGTLP